jgi:hypothetical protein
MAAPAQAVAQNPADAGYDIAPIAPWPESGEWTGPIDQQLLGFQRDPHHQFLLGGFAARAVRIEHAGRTVSYAYIPAQGHLGPLAIVPDADAKAVVTLALRCALEGGASQVSMLVPGRADVIMQTVLFQISAPSFGRFRTRGRAHARQAVPRHRGSSA